MWFTVAELAVLIALLLGGLGYECRHDGVTLFAVGFAFLFAGSIASRLLVLRGRLRRAPLWLFAFELAAFGGLLAFEVESGSHVASLARCGYGFVGLAALYLATIPLEATDAPRASWLEEAAFLLLAVGGIALAFLVNADRRGVLAVAAISIPLLLEAYGPRAPRSVAATVRRVSAFGVAIAAALLAGREFHEGVRVDDGTFGMVAFLALLAAIEVLVRIFAASPTKGLDELLRRIIEFGEGRGAALGVASALVLGSGVLLALGTVRLRVHATIEPSHVTHEDGHAFRYRLVGVQPDDGEQISTLRLFEDGKPLGPAHATMGRVRGQGRGAFFHDSRVLLFSSSDDSSVLTNGRSYTSEYDWRPGPWLMGGLLLVVSVLNARRARRLAARLETVSPGTIAFALAAITFAFRLQVAFQDGAEIVSGFDIKGMPHSDARGWFMLSSDFAKNARWDPSWTCWDARRPFYYVFLGSIFAWTGASVFVAQVANMAASALGAMVIFDAVRRVSSRPVAIVCALVHAFHRTGVSLDLSTMTESLGAFLSDVALWAFVVATGEAATRARRAGVAFFGSGVALALSNLARPLTMPAVVGLPLVLAYMRKQSGLSFRRVVLAAVLLGGGLGVTVLPWILRQHAKYGIWTISDNTAETFYGATDPRFGQWTGEVGTLAGNRSMHERVEFYSAGTRRNLREHLGWYVHHTLQQLALTINRTSVPLWVFAAMGALSLATVLGASEPLVDPRQRRAAFAAACLVGLAALEAPPLHVVSILAVLYVAFVRQPMTAIVGMHLPTVVAIALVAVATDTRFTYALTWQRAAFASELVLAALAFIATGEKPSTSWRAAETWGRARKPLAVVLALLGAFWVSGLIRSRLADPGTAPVSPVVEPSPWVAKALEGEGAVFAELAPKLVARRIHLRRGFSPHFAANEVNRHWSEMFDPRPYEFTFFESEEPMPENYALFPGALPSDLFGRELVIVGFHRVAPEWGHSVEVIAILDGSGAPLLRPRPEVARVFARELRALSER